MKIKHLILIITFLSAASLPLSAQMRTVFVDPWEGEKSLTLRVGAISTSADYTFMAAVGSASIVEATPTSIEQTLPLLLGMRFELYNEISSTLLWGWDLGFGFHNDSYKATFDGADLLGENGSGYYFQATRNYIYDQTMWRFDVEAGVLATWRPVESIELVVGGAIYADIPMMPSFRLNAVEKTSGAEEEVEHSGPFEGGYGIAVGPQASLQLSYYINERLSVGVSCTHNFKPSNKIESDNTGHLIDSHLKGYSPTAVMLTLGFH